MKTALFTLLCASAFTAGFYGTTSMVNVQAIESPASRSPHPHRIETSSPRFPEPVPATAKPVFRADAGTPIKLAKPIAHDDVMLHCSPPRLLANSDWQHVSECAL